MRTKILIKQLLKIGDLDGINKIFIPNRKIGDLSQVGLKIDLLGLNDNLQF